MCPSGVTVVSVSMHYGNPAKRVCLAQMKINLFSPFYSGKFGEFNQLINLSLTDGYCFVKIIYLSLFSPYFLCLVLLNIVHIPHML